MPKKIKAYLYPTPAQLAARNNDHAPLTAAMLDAVAETLLEEAAVSQRIAELLDNPEAALRFIPSSRWMTAAEIRQAFEDNGPLWPDRDEEASFFDEGADQDGPSAPSSHCGCAAADRADEFVWITHKGEHMYLDEMATPHIFYSLRMIFNHTVPPVFRVGEFKRYPDVAHWSSAYRQRAIEAFVKELEYRQNKPVALGGLEPELKNQFADMRANTNVILALGL